MNGRSSGAVVRVPEQRSGRGVPSPAPPLGRSLQTGRAHNRKNLPAGGDRDKASYSVATEVSPSLSSASVTESSGSPCAWTTTPGSSDCSGSSVASCEGSSDGGM